MTANSKHAPAAVARVLIVDDEAKLRESLAEGLRLEKWEILTAGSAAEAIRLIEAEKLDLLVLDWMLPDGDGIDVLRRMRTSCIKLPVLMISARVARRDVSIALANGATEFLAKPFAFGDLLARCSALLAADGPRRGS